MSKADSWTDHNEAIRVAEVIRAQLGHHAHVMMGAHSPIALADGYKVRIKGCPLGNCLMIQLDPSDTYNVSLWSIRGANARQADRVDGIYVDRLHATIEKMTGLRLSLTRVYR